jgi:predicted transcriptional regulator
MPSPQGAVTTEKLDGFLPVLKKTLDLVQKTVEELQSELEK